MADTFVAYPTAFLPNPNSLLKKPVIQASVWLRGGWTPTPSLLEMHLD